jgi:predicted transcriptional regulator/transcriptional regulator with XRE-family HTH domain
MSKLYAGPRIRHLREGRAMSQAELARALGISASYVNQLERNRRPVTVPVLLRLTAVFDVPADAFSAAETGRLVAQLRDAFADGTIERSPAASDLEELATSLPETAAAVIDLHRRHRDALERLQAGAVGRPGDATGATPDLGPLMPHETVRDIFNAHNNHFPTIDEAAEDRATALGFRAGEARPALLRHLREQHGVRTVLRPAQGTIGPNRSFDRDRRLLTLGAHLRPGQQAFQMATQLAFLEQEDEIQRLVALEAPLSAETADLLRIGLANHYAGALLLPYAAFHTAAEEVRYDAELLAVTFGVGFEVICHRLSTLQRPGMKGVPFSLVRVDRAGNVSKRQSSTGFHFSRFGGTCPLWVVYDAFATPGSTRTQLARMPDGREFLWIARTTSRGQVGFGRPTKTFAIGLGCEAHHASRTVYGDALVPAAADAAVPIGMGCKACTQEGCPQRAFPPAGRTLEIDRDVSTFDPYRVRGGVG